MKRIKFQLPEEVYYQFQQMAGEARQEPDEFMKQVLLEKVEHNPEKDLEEAESQKDLHHLVLDWDWPEKQLRKDTVQFENVSSVVRAMANGCDFPEAIKRRAELAIEDDDTRTNAYHHTVRKDCTSADRGVAHGAEEFRKEVDEMLDSHFIAY